MKIHREGFTILSITIILLMLLNLASYYFSEGNSTVTLVVGIISPVLFLLVLQFFRVPGRDFIYDEKLVIAPCDGKVVVIEEAFEPEFFKDKRVQISIFMSPINVHVNWYPVSGNVRYVRYHKGKYLVAWHPKASTDNERSTIVIENERKIPVLVRQIAGALAKRIVFYPHENDKVRQGSELGFIKFGSRMDIFLPL